MIGRCIQNQAIGIAQLHTCNHATHLLTSRQYACFLQHLLAGKQHTSQEALHVDFIAFTELAQPVHQIQVCIKECSIVQRQVSGGDSHTPVEGTRIRFHILVDNLEQSGHGTRVVRKEYNLVSLLYVEVDIAEQHRTIFQRFRQTGNFQNLITRFAFGRKDDARILT